MGRFRIRKKKHKAGRVVSLSPEAVAAMERQLQAFKEKFGREAGPDDPIFFDPDNDTPTPISDEKLTALMMEAMGAAGIEPEKMYAYAKTGLLPTDENMGQLGDEAVEDWNQAIAEARQRMQKKQ